MEKIKHFIQSDQGKDILTVCIIILVGLGCFMLGRLSAVNSPKSPEIGYVDPSSKVSEAINNSSISPKSDLASSADSTGKNFFASSRGSKYYPVNCTAGKTIKPENKIYFMTGKEAETAGYTLSGSCS